jgi:hypothetical protein
MFIVLYSTAFVLSNTQIFPRQNKKPHRELWGSRKRLGGVEEELTSQSLQGWAIPPRVVRGATFIP